MANLPCPNPACTHVFSAEQVQNSDLLKCPRCGTQYRFRAPSASAPPAKATPAKPVAPKSASPPRPDAPAPPPLAAPVVASRPAPPLATPVAPVARPVATTSASAGDTLETPVALPEPAVDATAFSTHHGPLVRARGIVRNRWTTKHFVVLGFGVVSIGVLVTLAILYMQPIRSLFRPGGDDTGAGGRALLLHARNVKGKDEKCIRVSVPETWSQDKELKANLTALGAWKHTEGWAWFAIAAQDFDQQRPRDSELMRAAVERLESYFGDSLELATKTFKTQLAGEECQCLRYKGTISSVTWFGECYLFAHHGFGYWMFVSSSAAWDSPDDAAQLKAELEKGKGLALVTDRKGWREQPPKMETFRNQEATFTMTVPAGAWEKSPAKDVEDTGELYLFGRFQKEKDNRKNASMLVFTTDKKSDLKESLREARVYIDKRKQEENDKYKYLLAEDGASETGASQAVGNRPGQIVELKLALKDEPKRYAILAAVHHEDKAYVVLCDCAWEHRQIWQQDFRNAMATLKFTRRE